MDYIKNVLEILPSEIRCAAEQFPEEKMEEFRLRAGCPPTVLIEGRERILPVRTGFGLVTCSDLQEILLGASEHSAYAVNETMREGYLTLPGGHRIGICGSLVKKDGEILSIKEISSLCIRISREPPLHRCGLLEQLSEPTLILGPPGCGKTTLLRACIRLLSDSGRRVSVEDDRGEIAACWRGIPQRNVGVHTDVLTGGEKKQGMLWLLRTMNPEWIAVDEITSPGDLDAMETCSYCGVKLLATAHAGGIRELSGRPLYQNLLDLKLFRQLFILDYKKQFYTERM